MCAFTRTYMCVITILKFVFFKPFDPINSSYGLCIYSNRNASNYNYHQHTYIFIVTIRNS